ncbi:pimeloyl-ACP methyl ester carboxylesterase [Actinoplanes tereljensis]|uniref:Microsomal epoxide hydrolase n=1 Tax=Paractinoplanes tereljensis TaxID=571912 RepID=A0A919TSN6_9ACTN|nr:epoxide hydrolase family protein [Actinoplanes tereljensis]GIF20751.1 microsomal epoxide hydrolase [Actinoplanes tereljensis]
MNEFEVHVSEADLDDLRDRLGRTRWPDELPGSGWDYGIPLERVQHLAAAWQNYDWRRHEARLNAYPQFTTTIDGENVWFLHIRSADPNALPLILTHGWPGSPVEFLDLIPLLTPHFHLVIPAIPGYSFSGPTRSRGRGLRWVAEAWSTLMARLGYDRYGAQGGDWGSGISQLLGSLDQDHVAGVHVNFLPTGGPYDGPLSPEDQARLARTQKQAANRHPHQVQFAAAPQTVAYALTDSPVGQLAFLAEKFTTWADPAHPIPDETILDDVMHYWLTRTAASSSRLIKETGLGGKPAPCPVPLGVAVLPYDIVQSVRPLVEQNHDVRRWSEFSRGGHFAALEVPALLAADIAAFFGSL